MLHEILGAMADQQLAALRAERANATPAERLKLARESWTRLLGDTTPPREVKVREGSRGAQQAGPLTVTREILETAPGIAVPVLSLSQTSSDGKKNRWRPLVMGVASDGIAAALARRRETIAAGLASDCVIALVDIRGTGATSSGSDRGQQSAATSHSATQLMLGGTMLGGQLRDLRAAWQHLRRRDDVRLDGALVAGGTGTVPLPYDARFSYPRRIDGRPPECQPTGALLALLLALYEDGVGTVACRGGLTTYRSLLDSPFVQIPHECIVPGLLRESDLPDLVAALAPRSATLEMPVDGRGRRVPLAAIEQAYDAARRAFADAGATSRLEIVDSDASDPKPK
jgi:hypothetical protein